MLPSSHIRQRRWPAGSDLRRATFVGVVLVMLAVVTSADVWAQDEAVPSTVLVRGRVMDAESGQGVSNAVVQLPARAKEALTDEDGTFVFAGLEPGLHVFVVAHLAYGRHEQAVQIEPGPMIALRIMVSPEAIELDPIVVEARTAEEQRIRSQGTRSNVLDYAELQEASRTSRFIHEVLRREVPGIRVRETGPVNGSRFCMEFRTAGTPRFAGCNFPTVFLDGVRVFDPGSLLSTLDMSTLNRVEVVPPAEAGVRFGTESAYGVLLLETRMWSDFQEADDLLRSTLHQQIVYDWDDAPDEHATWRVLGISVLTNAAAVAAGVAIADRCLDYERLTVDLFYSECDTGGTLGAHAALFGLPLATAALTTRLTGGTDHSYGRMFPAALLSAVALIPGYALSTSGQVADSPSVTSVGGRLFLLVGVPLAATMADRLFRRVRR